MNNKRTYQFRYNLPADNHLTGRPDLYIECYAEWNKGSFHESGKPIIIFEGPVIEKLSKHILFCVIDWRKVFAHIETIAQDYFLDNYVVDQPQMNVVQIAEEVLQ